MMVAMQKETSRSAEYLGCRVIRPVLFVWVGACLAYGCSRAPKNLSPPSIDPEQAATKAMEIFDTNADGLIDASELTASPGLTAALATTDGDRDGALSRQEIRDRLSVYVDSQTAIRNFQIGIEHRGSGIRDLEIRVVPEPFLADYIESAVGMTNSAGVATPGIEFKDPEIAKQGYGGLRLGMYRVEVRQPDSRKKQVPDKYNVDTQLGVEVGLDHHAPLPFFKLAY